MRNEESAQIDRMVEEMMNAPGEPGKKKRKRWSKKKTLLIGSVAVLAAAMVILPRISRQKDSVPVVNVMELTRQPIQEKLSLSGPVSGTDSVDVVSNLHAQISALNVKEGDQVKAGDVLATLDRTELEREVKLAQNAYNQALAAKEQKDKSESLAYEKAVQDLSKAQVDFERNSQLFAAGDISQAEMEEAQNALADARRGVEAFTVKNGRATADPSFELQVESAHLELEKKQEELASAQIQSEIDGTVVRVNSKVGQFADKVENDKPIFSIENLDELELKIQVSEYSIGKLALGQKAMVSADILGDRMEEGEIVKISPTGEEKDGGSTERVIPITVRIDGKNSGLMAGITAKAQILIREAQDALVVPNTALIEEADATYVAVLEDGKIRRVPVTLGVDGDLNVEVIPIVEQDLTEGMMVVTNPSPDLVDGMAAQAEGSV